jgi:hypothetical protein
MKWLPILRVGVAFWANLLAGSSIQRLAADEPRANEVMEKPPGEAPPVVLQRPEIDERWDIAWLGLPRRLLDEFTRDEITGVVA